MNIDTPTLSVGIVVSAVGYVLFSYGKKQQRIPHVVFGLAVMIYPYFTGGWILTLAIGVVLVTALWLLVRSGL